MLLKYLQMLYLNTQIGRKCFIQKEIKIEREVGTANLADFELSKDERLPLDLMLALAKPPM